MQTPFMVDGKPFFIIGGQVHNSSGYSPDSMQPAWKALIALHANTAEVPVYWEQVEPQEGCFEFAALDGIVSGAREHGLKLVLLWFATWKNGSMQYAPDWVKANPARFKQVMNPAGRPIWVLSSHCRANFEADRNAFCALMSHLKEIDAAQHTVVGIQLENEPGILSSVRDYGPEAEGEFQAVVPKALIEKLSQAPGDDPYMDWLSQGCPEDKCWDETFCLHAAEYFSAWSIANYMDGIAQAGKAVNPLPVYANAWLYETGWRLPGTSYPSGGPTSNVIALWKWATPHLDLLAPDIYVENADTYQAICQAYARPDNPLFVPESWNHLPNAMNLFEAVGRWGAVGYALFGVESLLDPQGQVEPEARQTVESFHCLASAAPLLIEYHGTDLVHTVRQAEFAGEQLFDFGRYWGVARFASSDGPSLRTDFMHRPHDAAQRGRGLIFTPSLDEFYLVGAGFRLILKEKVSDRLEFSKSSADFDLPLMNYLRVEEGHFDEQGRWVVDRVRNGDEITPGLWVAPDVGLVHAVLSA